MRSLLYTIDTTFASAIEQPVHICFAAIVVIPCDAKL